MVDGSGERWEAAPCCWGPGSSEYWLWFDGREEEVADADWDWVEGGDSSAVGSAAWLATQPMSPSQMVRHAQDSDHVPFLLALMRRGDVPVEAWMLLAGRPEKALRDAVAASLNAPDEARVLAVLTEGDVLPQHIPTFGHPLDA